MSDVATTKQETPSQEAQAAIKFIDSQQPVYNGFGDQMYQDLMTEWMNLREQLNRSTVNPYEIKKTIADFKDELDNREAMIVLNLGGWKKMGSNDGERKMTLTRALADNEPYQLKLASMRKAEQEYAEANAHIESLQKQLHAVGNAMRMHAAMVLAQAAVSVELPIAPNNDLYTDDDLDL